MLLKDPSKSGSLPDQTWHRIPKNLESACCRVLKLSCYMGYVFIQPIGPRPRRPADGRELDAGPRFCRGTFDSAKEQ